MPILGLRLPPALAGGRLRNWNHFLWLIYSARVRSEQCGEVWTPQLVLDPAIEDPDRHTFLLLDSKGNPCRIPGSTTFFCNDLERNALLQTILGRLPETAEAKEVVLSHLPEVGQDVMNASLEFWCCVVKRAWPEKSSMPPVSVTTVEAGEVPDDWMDAAAAPELVWISQRQHRTLFDLGVPLDQALQGEKQLRKCLDQNQKSPLSGQIQDLKSLFQDHLSQLKNSTLEETPGLYGSWARLRRGGNRAIADFQKSVGRFERNKKGIRGQKIHLLAQALRPGDEAQQDGLGLLYAFAILHLQAEAAVKHSNVFHGSTPQDTLVVNAETGILSRVTVS